MNSYTPTNPPKSGTARKIWTQVVAAGYAPLELHYNPNCYGRGQLNGWGTWAITIEDKSVRGGMHGRAEFWCGLHDGRVYLMGSEAPFLATYIGPDPASDPCKK